MKLFTYLTVFIVLLPKAFAFSELKSGDIILQPLKCWACSLIEQQENSEYSHIGIVVKRNNQLLVAEAYGKVQLVTITDFLSKTHPNKSNKFLRFKALPVNETKLFENIQKLIGNPYDPEFRWNNFIGDKEAIYCSELVYKVLNPLVKFSDLGPKRMLFDENAEAWDRYFRGNTPRGELGVSPEDFNQSLDFEEITIKEE